jgi:hypothetical protein
MHTTVSDGVHTIHEILSYITQQKRLDVIAITDHDRLEAALWAYDHQNRYPFEIIPGVEVSSVHGHLLGLWVTHKIPKNMPLAETVAAIHEQGGIAILAHPFHIHLGPVARNFYKYLFNSTMLTDAQLDGLEAYHSGVTLPGTRLLTQAMARRLGLAMTGSSDSHILGAIGTGVTRFKGKTAADLRRALEKRETIAEGTAWHLIDYWIYSRNSTHNASSEFLVESSS